MEPEKFVINNEKEIIRLIDRRIKFEEYKPYIIFGIYCIVVAIIVWSIT